MVLVVSTSSIFWLDASKLLHVKVVAYESPNWQYLHVMLHTTTVPDHTTYITYERRLLLISWLKGRMFLARFPIFQCFSSFDLLFQSHICSLSFDQDSLQDVSSDSVLESADKQSVVLVAVVVVAAAAAAAGVVGVVGEVGVVGVVEVVGVVVVAGVVVVVVGVVVVVDSSSSSSSSSSKSSTSRSGSTSCSFFGKRSMGW